jgi:hypothetical protein
VQTLNALQDNPQNFETHKRTIQAINALIQHLGPGDAIKPQNFSVGSGFGTGASISALSGTFKRGSFVVSAGTGGFLPNPSVTLNFPSGIFATPFAIVVRNGGNGALGFSYTQTGQALIITLTGTVTGGTKYGFQFDVRD